MIAETIVVEVKKAKSVSVNSNEVEDAGSMEQISLVVRYVHKEQITADYVVKESFVGFNEQHCQVTGDAIASTILNKLEEMGLNFDFFSRQGYDGSAWINGREKKRSKQYNIANISLGNIYIFIVATTYLTCPLPVTAHNC